MRGSQKRFMWLATEAATPSAPDSDSKKAPMSFAIFTRYSVFTRAASCLEALFVRVDDVLVLAREADEREAAVLREADRERGRRRHRREKRNADGGRLLHHLVAGAA